MVTPHISHVVKLTREQMLELYTWLVAGMQGTITLDRVTFERTAQDCVFVSTVPMPDLPKKPEPEEIAP